MLSKFCGEVGIQDMVSKFSGLSAQMLYDALSSLGAPPDQVFDVIR